MEKSSASSQSQEPPTRRRMRQIASTPRPEAMTPPAAQAMVQPAVCTSQPPETSEGKMYLEILKDAMERISSTGKMSDIFAQLANQFKEKEENPKPVPTEIPTGAAAQTEQPLTRQSDEHEEEAVQEPSEEGDQAKGDSERTKEAVVWIDEGPEFDEETLDERTKRRNLREAKKEEMVEIEGKLVE